MDTVGFILNHVNYGLDTGSTRHGYGVSWYGYGMRKSNPQVTCVQP